MPNVIHDLSFEDYCKLDLINASTLKAFMPGSAPAKLGVHKSTSSLDTGKLLHARMEGPLEDHSDIAVSDYSDFRKKEAREWKAEQEFNMKTVIKRADMESIECMYSSITRKCKEVELDIEGEDEVTITDADYKIRIDRRHHEHLIDWKTCQSASPRAIARDIDSYNYDLQAAFYSDVEDMGKPFFFVFVETSAPYICTVVDMSVDAMTVGREKYKSALKRMKTASKDEGYLPAGQMFTYDAPDFRKKQIFGEEL